MKTPRLTINAITLLTLLLCGWNAVQAQGTAFTYQGRLSEGTNPANGSYDFRFALYTADTGGSPAGTLTNSSVTANNGLFTATLDFGAGLFDGTAYWLAIGVRTNGSTADFTTLNPRQALTPHPYALYAPNAGAAATATTATTASSANAVAAGNITGTIPDARLSPNVALLNGNASFGGPVTATTFSGNGGGLTNVNSATFNGLSSGAFAQLAASQTFNGANVFSNPANRFAGDGGGLTNLNASALASGAVNPARLSSAGALTGQVLKFNGSQVTWGQDNDTAYAAGSGLSLIGNQFSVNFAGSGSASSTARSDHNHDPSYWKRGGNSSTTPGTDFLGTTDIQPLELRVNNQRGLRLEPGGTNGPNVILGHYVNSVSPGVVGAVIGGGGGASVTVGTLLTNRVTDAHSIVAGGLGNVPGNDDADPANARYATVGGGVINWAAGRASTISGGEDNTASGIYATVPGGGNNNAAGAYSFAAGHSARAGYDGDFVWNDTSGAINAKASNQFVVKATGGFFFVTATNLDSSDSYNVGAYLPANSGSWVMLSDRNAKQNIAPVEPKRILEELLAVPVASWNYKAQEELVRHIGPMAQDFYLAFGVGEDDRGIATVDADGVALAAIQGLNQKVEEETAQLRRELNDRDAQIAQLKQSVAELHALMRQLTQPRTGDAR